MFIKKIIQNLINYIFIFFTCLFLYAYFTSNFGLGILVFSSFSITFLISKWLKRPNNGWALIRTFCLLKILFLYIYINSDMLYCSNEINKVIVETTIDIGNKVNISQQTSLTLLQTLGAITLLVGSVYLGRNLYDFYVAKSKGGEDIPSIEDLKKFPSMSDISSSSGLPDTLSAPCLDDIKSVSSYSSLNSSLFSSNNSLSIEEQNEISTIKFSDIYNDIINYDLNLTGVENYNANLRESPNICSNTILLKRNFEKLAIGFCNKHFQEHWQMHYECTKEYLENLYQLGYIIHGIIQNINYNRYLDKTNLLVDLCNLYEKIHKSSEYHNINFFYSTKDIVDKILPMSRDFLIAKGDSLIEFNKLNCLFQGFNVYCSSTIPLSPIQYHEYQEALDFVFGVVKKDKIYKDLISRLTNKDFTILEFSLQNIESTGLSTSNCLMLFKVAAYCLFNVNLGYINNVDDLVVEFLAQKSYFFPEPPIQDEFLDLNNKANEKNTNFKNKVIRNFVN